MARKGGKHPGFQNLVDSGVPGGALADSSRNASPAAKKKNPRLKRVKGSARKRGRKKGRVKGRGKY